MCFFLLCTYVYCCCFCASACFAKSYTSYTVHVHYFHSSHVVSTQANLGYCPGSRLTLTRFEVEDDLRLPPAMIFAACPRECFLICNYCMYIWMIWIFFVIIMMYRECHLSRFSGFLFLFCCSSSHLLNVHQLQAPPPKVWANQRKRAPCARWRCCFCWVRFHAGKKFHAGFPQ